MDRKNLKPVLFDANINVDLMPLVLIGFLWFLYVSRNK